MGSTNIEKKHKKIAVIVPYFGTLPNYFSLWVNSVKNNPEIDFLVYSNNKCDYEVNNLIWHEISFEDIRSKINKAVGFKVRLDNPYKLCDFRPAYGDIFYDDIKEYEFWGFCDIDLIFGNIHNFITEEILETYDKIGSHGHFVLYRNTSYIRNLYKYKDYYKTVFTIPINTSFDEGNGFFGVGDWDKQMNIKLYWKRDFADISTNSFQFRCKISNLDGCVAIQNVQFCHYENGKILISIDGILREMSYVHFQRRHMKVYVKDYDSYYAIPNRFIQSIEGLEQYVFDEDRQPFEENILEYNHKALMKRLRRIFYFLISGKLFKREYFKYCFDKSK